jgi:hypothetical protein
MVPNFFASVNEDLKVRDSAGFEGRGGTNRAGFLSLISYPKSIPWINHRAQLFFLLFLKLLASWAYPPAKNRFEIIRSGPITGGYFYFSRTEKLKKSPWSAYLTRGGRSPSRGFCLPGPKIYQARRRQDRDVAGHHGTNGKGGRHRPVT